MVKIYHIWCLESQTSLISLYSLCLGAYALPKFYQHSVKAIRHLWKVTECVETVTICSRIILVLGCTCIYI